MDVDDSVRVDIEGDLDLRQPARRGRNSDQIELPEQLVVRRHLALALEDANRDRGLVVLRGREDLALARRDGRVLFDQLGEHAAERLDSQRQRSHVEQQHVFDFALEHARLDCRADRDHFVRVDALVAFLAEQALDALLHRRHPRHPADQHDLVDLAGLQPRVAKRRHARRVEPIEQVGAQRLELRAA